MSNMTAVEYLMSTVKSPEWQDMYIWHKEDVFKKALAMEKEQILKAWMATDNELQRIAAEQYYNETYGDKK